MQFAINELKNTNLILSRIAFKLACSSSIGQIIASDNGVPPIKALVLSNPHKYCHKSNVAKN